MSRSWYVTLVLIASAPQACTNSTEAPAVKNPAANKAQNQTPKATAERRQDPRVVQIVGLMTSETKADGTEAKRLAGRLLQERPTDLQARILYALTMARNGEGEKALAEARALKVVHPKDGRCDAVIGSILLSMKKYEETVNLVAPLVRAQPNNKYLHHVLAGAYYELGNKLKSKEHLARLKQLDPEYDGVPVSWEAFVKFIAKHGDKIISGLTSAFKIVVMFTAANAAFNPGPARYAR